MPALRLLLFGGKRSEKANKKQSMSQQIKAENCGPRFVFFATTQ
jgi:hypothetical protein